MNRSGKDFDRLCREMRGMLVELSHKAATPHLGSSLSCVEIVAAAYSTLHISPELWTNPERDRILLSKGHASTTLYAALYQFKFLDDAVIDTYAQPGSVLPEHPSPGPPGIENASGSLGHALGLGVGIAMGARIQKQSYRVCVLMSDGECNEGSVWEAAMFAPAQKLERLMAVIDYNKWQATGRSNEVMALAPLADKFRAFGWSVYEMDGHDGPGLCNRMRNFPDGSGKPIMIVANTVKGKGVSFMEDDNNWHYRIPSVEEVAKAKAELKLS